MTQIQTNKADLLRALETEQEWWRAVLDLAAEDGALTGDEEIDGSWTLKEVIAHVAGWRDWTLARLEAAADGGTPVTPWPGEMPEETEEDVDRINAWFSEQARAVSLDETVAHLNDQLDALGAVVQRMSDEDLFTAGRFATMDAALASVPIGPALIGYSITHAHEEHAPAIQAWLNANQGQHVELPPAPSNFGYDE